MQNGDEGMIMELSLEVIDGKVLVFYCEMSSLEGF